MSIQILFGSKMKMNTRSSSLNRARWSSVTAIMGFLAVLSAVGDDLPESIASEWKVKTDQIEMLWDSKSKILQFRQLAAKAVVYGPSNLYELPYEIAFQSAVPDASILLILGADGTPTQISKKFVKNESGNPQVYITNKAGMIVGDWGYINNPN